jgi:hypothetical protein
VTGRAPPAGTGGSRVGPARRGLVLGTALILLAACGDPARRAQGDAGRPRPTPPAAGRPAAPGDPGLQASPEPRPFPGPIRPWTISRIRGELRDALVPRNWRPGCPVPLSRLRWLTVAYHGFDGERKVGPLVVHASAARDVLWVFRRLFRAGFPIRHVGLPRR